jgi:hypothetical protein
VHAWKYGKPGIHGKELKDITWDGKGRERQTNQLFLIFFFFYTPHYYLCTRKGMGVVYFFSPSVFSSPFITHGKMGGEGNNGCVLLGKLSLLPIDLSHRDTQTHSHSLNYKPTKTGKIVCILFGARKWNTYIHQIHYLDHFESINRSS